jgi:hypothetical protein
LLLGAAQRGPTPAPPTAAHLTADTAPPAQRGSHAHRRTSLCTASSARHKVGTCLQMRSLSNTDGKLSSLWHHRRSSNQSKCVVSRLKTDTKLVPREVLVKRRAPSGRWVWAARAFRCGHALRATLATTILYQSVLGKLTGMQILRSTCTVALTLAHVELQSSTASVTAPAM